MVSPKLWQDPFELFTGHNYLSPILSRNILTAWWLFQLCSF
jgi:hypothetical protein